MKECLTIGLVTVSTLVLAYDSILVHFCFLFCLWLAQSACWLCSLIASSGDLRTDGKFVLILLMLLIWVPCGNSSISVSGCFCAKQKWPLDKPMCFISGTALNNDVVLLPASLNSEDRNECFLVWQGKHIITVLGSILKIYEPSRQAGDCSLFKGLLYLPEE